MEQNNLSPTVHNDGTVSYWSVYRQQWVREYHVPCNELAAMPEYDRHRVIVKHPRP